MDGLVLFRRLPFTELQRQRSRAIIYPKEQMSERLGVSAGRNTSHTHFEGIAREPNISIRRQTELWDNFNKGKIIRRPKAAVAGGRQ